MVYLDFMWGIGDVKLSLSLAANYWEKQFPSTIELLLVLYLNANPAKSFPHESMMLLSKYNLVSSLRNKKDPLKLKTLEQTLNVRVE